MSVKHFTVALQHFRVFQSQMQNPNIPQYHILILAWSALVVLYGENDLSLPSRT